jgi:hypothetical protein
LVSFDVHIRMYKEFAGSERNNTQQDGQGFLNDRSSQRFVTFDQTTPPTRIAPEQVLAYFTRPKTSASQKQPVRGRFDDRNKWTKEYWSQFAL